MGVTHELDTLLGSSDLQPSVGGGTPLRQFSPSDAKWDDRRAESDRIGEMYRDTILAPLADKIRGCAQRLWMAWQIGETGDEKLKLQAAWFCRERACSLCQWRKSMKWKNRAFKLIPAIMDEYPTYRFIFLTLTVKNCHVSDLKETLGKMSKAWGRLTKKKEWPAEGWLRSVEVTRNQQDDTCHPHYHCLLMVKPGYFSGGNYLSQEKWTNLWKEALKIDYPPIVDIRRVKDKKGNNDDLAAVLETCKYPIKPSDLAGQLKDGPTERDIQWLVTLTQQLKGTRSVATGGLLKEKLRELENENPDDLIHINENGETNDDIKGPSIPFDWVRRSKRYEMPRDGVE